MQPIDLTIKEQPEHIERCVAMALDIQSKLANKMSVSDKFVSLGQNCSSAWYLKQLGLKLESYPFDWIFGKTKKKTGRDICYRVQKCPNNGILLHLK